MLHSGIRLGESEGNPSVFTVNRTWVQLRDIAIWTASLSTCPLNGPKKVADDSGRDAAFTSLTPILTVLIFFQSADQIPSFLSHSGFHIWTHSDRRFGR